MQKHNFSSLWYWPAAWMKLPCMETFATRSSSMALTVRSCGSLSSIYTLSDQMKCCYSASNFYILVGRCCKTYLEQVYPCNVAMEIQNFYVNIRFLYPSYLTNTNYQAAIRELL